MDKNEFEIEFQSEAEISEMLDGIVMAVGEMIAAEEDRAAFLNPMKIQQMQFSYGVIKYLTQNTGAKMSYALNEPFKSMGSISVEGKCLEFANSEWFARAAEFASNTEVYPLTNGKVRLTLTFHGIVLPIE